MLFKIFSGWVATDVDDVTAREKMFKQAASIQGFKIYLNNLETDKRMVEAEQE